MRFRTIVIVVLWGQNGHSCCGGCARPHKGPGTSSLPNLMLPNLSDPATFWEMGKEGIKSPSFFCLGCRDPVGQAVLFNSSNARGAAGTSHTVGPATEVVRGESRLPRPCFRDMLLFLPRAPLSHSSSHPLTLQPSHSMCGNVVISGWITHVLVIFPVCCWGSAMLLLAGCSDNLGQKACSLRCCEIGPCTGIESAHVVHVLSAVTKF